MKTQSKKAKRSNLTVTVPPDELERLREVEVAAIALCDDIIDTWEGNQNPFDGSVALLHDLIRPGARTVPVRPPPSNGTQVDLPPLFDMILPVALVAVASAIVTATIAFMAGICR